MRIHYNNREIDLPSQSRGEDLAEQLHLTQPDQALVILINGVCLDLSSELKEGDVVQFLHFEDPKGEEVFWHTSAHVLAQGVLRLWPDALPAIGPPIEGGFYYDFARLSLSEEDLPKLEKEIKKILAEKWKPQRRVFKDKKEALLEFQHNPYKMELIESFDESSPITAYQQGEFFDLCRGPHLPTLGKIRAFKLLKVSGAYWRGNAENEMLTRLYGVSFPDRAQMQAHLHLLEQAKKRDHRLLGAQLDLFSFKEAAPSMPFIHPAGMVIWDRLLSYWHQMHRKAGYVLIKTPQLMTKELWIVSGHWEYYRDNMFITYAGKDKPYAIKPMNCPGCILYYQTHAHSYREFPLKIAEVGHVHRREPSGALSGLLRVQSFHQDDAHLFMKKEQIKQEIENVLSLAKEIYSTFGLSCHFELSTRPEKSIGAREDWDFATKGLQEALDAWGALYRVNEGDGAFYGPKIDLHVRDALGRAWQLGTIQLDFALPERFELEFKDSDGKLKRPIMIHRALFGSIERFFAILIEHFSGKFPLWLSPRPVRLLPVAERHLEYARKVQETIQNKGFECVIDRSMESVSKKVRSAQLLKVNYMLILGDQEEENQTVCLRTRDNFVYGQIDLSSFLNCIEEEYQERHLHSPYQQRKPHANS